jgi:hypothetical protein
MALDQTGSICIASFKQWTIILSFFAKTGWKDAKAKEDVDITDIISKIIKVDCYLVM